MNNLLVILIGILFASCELNTVEDNMESIIFDENTVKTDLPGIYQWRDSLDVLYEFGNPEMRTQNGDTTKFIYVDYYEVTFICEDIVQMVNIGYYNRRVVEFDDTILHKLHQVRFEYIMDTYGIEYTDAGCELGWSLAADPYRAHYTIEYASKLMRAGVPQWMYNRYFQSQNN